MAFILLNSFSTSSSSGRANPGRRERSWPKGPARRTASSWARKSSRVNSPSFRIFSALAATPASWSFSTRPERSPRPRMRSAIRPGSKGSRSSGRSPTPTKTMGRRSLEGRERAAPPRASPSSLVRTIPESPKGKKAWPRRIASCPTKASRTRRTSLGLTSRRSSPRNGGGGSPGGVPGVSKMATSMRSFLAWARIFGTCFGGSWSAEAKAIPIFWAKVCNCSAAAGRSGSAETKRGFLPRFRKYWASLPAVVVFPPPAGPTSITTAGFPESFSFWASPPMILAISWRTMAKSCWAGERDSTSFSPTALSRTRAKSSATTA